MGPSPCTWISGGGTTGSRKISRVPPDRHGLCTDSVPSVPDEWTRLADVLVLFEYGVGADGTTTSEYWEWK